MINYQYQNLFKKDSISKELSITGTGISIGNSNMDGESFALDEILNSGRELNFGECNSSKLSFSCGYYNISMVGKELTAKTTPAGGSEFQFGKYTVLSDEPTADRKWRDVIAYDALYNILKNDYVSWYNSLLPDATTSKTLKQFRDSFFSHIGITQTSVNLPNDNMTVKKTIDPKTLSGKNILYAICQCNGRFGRIGRNGNFQYVKAEIPREGLFPSETLYPSDTLYPRPYGFEERPIAENGTYLSCKYEDFLIQVIDKLIIKTAEDDTGVTIGSGNNPYIIQNNFLLFGKESSELTTIGTNIYNEISGVWYRPCSIEAVGNPCLECGDGIRLHTVDGKDIDTIILKRKLRGIQSLRDSYVADGVKKRENDPNSLQSQITQTQGSIRQIKADLIEAQRIIADDISADRARIGDLEADHVSVSDLNATNARVGSLEADHVSVSQLNAVDAKFNNLNADNITAGTISTDRLNINGIILSLQGHAVACDSLSSNYGYFGTGLYLMDGGVQNGFYRRTATVGGNTIYYWGY